jgi:hypothetical protein
VGFLILGLAAPDAVGARPASTASSRAIDDEGEDCLETVPAEASVAGVTDDGRNVDLDVHVLLDGVSVARGEDVMKRAATAYAPLHITLKATYEEVDFPAQRQEAEFIGDAERPTSDADHMFTKSKEAVGRPTPMSSTC